MLVKTDPPHWWDTQISSNSSYSSEIACLTWREVKILNQLCNRNKIIPFGKLLQIVGGGPATLGRSPGSLLEWLVLPFCWLCRTSEGRDPRLRPKCPAFQWVGPSQLKLHWRGWGPCPKHWPHVDSPLCLGILWTQGSVCALMNVGLQEC